MDCKICPSSRLKGGTGAEVVIVLGNLETMATRTVFYCRMHADQIWESYEAGTLVFSIAPYAVSVQADLALADRL